MSAQEQPQKHPVWLDDTHGVFTVHEEPIPYAVEVLATSLEVLQWQDAEQAWKSAQAQMKTRAEEVYVIEATIEEIENDLIDREDEKQRQDSVALAAIAEAEEEVADGPRQWVLVHLYKESNPTGWKSKQRLYAVRVHHKTCPVFRKIEAAIDAGTTTAQTSNHELLGGFARTPEALTWLTKKVRYDEPHPVACKRCAGALTAALSTPKES